MQTAQRANPGFAVGHHEFRPEPDWTRVLQVAESLDGNKWRLTKPVGVYPAGWVMNLRTLHRILFNT